MSGDSPRLAAGRKRALFRILPAALAGLLGSGLACSGNLARSAPAGRRAAAVNCAEGAGLAVVPLPLPHGWRRSRLTRDYVRGRYDAQATSLRFVPRMIVLHWTELPDLAALWNAFRPATIPPSRPELLSAGRVNVASQFVVDRDGAIYRLLPETAIARHTIGLNRAAIGIENVGGSEAPLTECQVRADAKLVTDLAARHPTIRYLIGHHEYGRFRGTPLWEERDPTYFTSKVDPGDEFMSAVRARVAPLRLGAEYATVPP
ncbi:MAG: peptidoglycan recognition family protein [Acidobacteriota bacterium]